MNLSGLTLQNRRATAAFWQRVAAQVAIAMPCFAALLALAPYPFRGETLDDAAEALLLGLGHLVIGLATDGEIIFGSANV